MTEQIPLWAWAIAATGLFSGFVYLIKYALDKNREDWHDMKGVVGELTKNVVELVGIQKLHTHQINENTEDIKKIESKLSGDAYIKYSK